jgi:signal transduction histidine kinase
VRRFLVNWSGTARKLALGFGALVFIVGAVSYVALEGLGRIGSELASIRREDDSVRLALELASAVRDQYAHQAHTIIIGDESHLSFYTEAQQRVATLTHELRRSAHAPLALTSIEEIERASDELDRIFRERIVPAVVRGDRAVTEEEHGRAQLVVTQIQDAAEHLIETCEAQIAASRAEMEAASRRAHRWILAMLAGAPLLAAGVTLVVGRSIARPLGRLHAGAERLAAGDLDAHIDEGAPDEFGALARQFNAMTAALKQHQAKLVETEKLAGIGRLAAGIAHEINNPLGVILGYTRLLQKRADAGVSDDLGVIAEEALRCKEIVEGLLDLSRPPQAGNEPVDLRAATHEVVERLRQTGVLEGVAVHVWGGATTPGHPSKLRQVLSNLVRNAAEESGPGGRVEISIYQRDELAHVLVRDSGPGLDAGRTSRLFEPFFTTKERGTGLGLAVSRGIARAHGGDIEAANAPGGGAVFTLRVPRLKAPAQVAEGVV